MLPMLIRTLTPRREFYATYQLVYFSHSNLSRSRLGAREVLEVEVCGSTIAATRPVPVADLLTRTRTRPAPKISTRPTRGYTHTRSLPVRI